MTSDPFQDRELPRSQWRSAQMFPSRLLSLLCHRPWLLDSSLVSPSWLFRIWWLRGNPPGQTVAGRGLPHLGLWVLLPLMAPEMVWRAEPGVLVDRGDPSILQRLACLDPCPSSSDKGMMGASACPWLAQVTLLHCEVGEHGLIPHPVATLPSQSDWVINESCLH